MKYIIEHVGTKHTTYFVGIIDLGFLGKSPEITQQKEKAKVFNTIKEAQKYLGLMVGDSKIIEI